MLLTTVQQRIGERTGLRWRAKAEEHLSRPCGGDRQLIEGFRPNARPPGDGPSFALEPPIGDVVIVEGYDGPQPTPAATA
jgi:hypothetical protein